MQTRIKLAILVSVVLSVALLTKPAMADTYSDPALHYSLELPANWVAMRADDIQTINAIVRQRGLGQSIQYTTGFRPKGSAAGSYPYILLETRPQKTGGDSYEQIEQALTKDLPGGVKQVGGAWADAIKNTSVGGAVMDRASNRMVIRLTTEVEKVGKVQAMSVYQLGSEGIVVLHCYALDQDFVKRLPEFEKINDALHFDEGYTFKPAAGAMRSILTTTLIGAVVGGVVGSAAWLIRKLRVPKKVNQKEPERE